MGTREMSLKEDIEFIEKILAEGNEYITRGDPVQASEKLYKAVEECVKLLAEEQKLPEYEEAQREGRWWSRLLSKAARRLTRELGEERIANAWTHAFDLHTWGFHERSLGIEDVKQDVPYVRWFVDYIKENLN